MEKGDVVRISYTGKLKGSGELFDTTSKETAEKEGAFNPRIDYGPVAVIVGGEMVVEGLDEELKNMEVGEEKKVTVPPERAFGSRDGDLIKTFSEKKFKDQDMTPAPGMRINMGGRMGRILSVNSGRVRIDLNHPLAGKTLEYEVKIEESVDDKEGKVRALGEYYLREGPEVEVKGDKAVMKTENKIREDIEKELKDKTKRFFGTELEIEQVEKDEDKSE